MRKNRMFISRLFLGICLLGTVSCEMRDELRNRMPGKTDVEAVGGFSLDLLSKETATRAENVVDQYTVQIVKTNGEVVREYDSYTQLQEAGSIIELPVGTYKVRSASYAGDEEEASINKPYYFSEKEFSVNAGEVTNLKDTCKLNSVVVNVNYDESFLSEVEDNYAVTFTNGTGVLTMNKDVNGVAYFRTAPSMLIAVRATTKNGTEVYKAQSMASKDGSSLKPEDKFEINLGIKDTIPANPGTPDNPNNPDNPDNPDDPNNPDNPDTPDVGGDSHFDITIDVTLNGKDVDITIPSPDQPTPDPDPTPNPDPDPTPDPGPSYAAPTIVGRGFNLGSTLTDPTTVQVDITAEAGIANLIVTIDSKALTEEVLGAVGLEKSFDLVNPGKNEEALKGLGLLGDEPIYGKKSLVFDISSFIELLPLLGDPGPHKFHLKVIDQKGKSSSETLSLIVSL